MSADAVGEGLSPAVGTPAALAGGNAIVGTFVSTGVIAAAGFVSGIVVARVLGPEMRGELAAVVVWTTVLAMAGDLGIGFAISYVVGRDRSLVGEAWTHALVWAAGLGSLLAVAATLFVPRVLHGAPLGTPTLVAGFSAIPFMLGASYQTYLLLGVGRLSEGNWVRVVAGPGYTLGVVLCTALGFATVGAFVAAFTAAQIASFVVATVLVLRRLRPRWRLGRETGAQLLRHGLKTQVASMAAQTNLRVAQLALAATFPPAALGLYAVAVAVASGTGPLFSAGAIVTIPHVLSVPDARSGSAQVIRFVKLTALLGVPVTVIGILVMPWVLPWLFGRAFESAVVSAQVLLVAGLLQGWSAVLGNGLRSLGRPGAPAIAEGAGLAITVALLTLLLPRLGIEGAALTSLAAYAGVATLQMALVVAGSGVSFAQLLRAPLGLSALVSEALPLHPSGSRVHS